MTHHTFNLFFFLILFLSVDLNFTFDHRSKRFLTFTRRNSAVIQIIAGVGLPVDLDLESVTIGYVFKAGFNLPMNASDFWSFLADPFDASQHTVVSRSVDDDEESALSGYDDEYRETFERHSVEANIVESGTVMNLAENTEQTNNLATTRWLIYKGLAEIAENNGLAGRPCVLRSICESAHTPFDYSNGILGELFHVVMTPSVTNEETIRYEDNEYLYAETIGREGAPCEKVFKECKMSILDLFTGIYATHSMV